MAQSGKRTKTQARRANGNGGGLPGWAWLVIGIALTLLVVLAAPKLFKSGDGGFFRPTPNPDAQPQSVDEEAVVDPEADAPATAAVEEPKDDKPTEYDFYRLLPGQEVPVSDAELAASEKAEQQAERERTEAAERAAAANAPEATRTEPLPAPVAETPAATPNAAPQAPAAPAAEPAPDARATAAAAADNARYLLQAGAFEASGQAEELKAKIALLGLGARVESASIRGKTVYRVRMGPYGTATDLAEAKRKLAAGGLPAIAVKTN